jgi:hypothetical protein
MIYVVILAAILLAALADMKQRLAARPVRVNARESTRRREMGQAPDEGQGSSNA